MRRTNIDKDRYRVTSIYIDHEKASMLRALGFNLSEIVDELQYSGNWIREEGYSLVRKAVRRSSNFIELKNISFCKALESLLLNLIIIA